MARPKNVVSLRGGEAGGEGGEDREARKAITEKDFVSLVKKCKMQRAEMDSARGTLGQLVSEAVESKHLHKGAFGIFMRLEKMDPYKRAELLFHLDLYRERAKWDETDLFPEREAAE